MAMSKVENGSVVLRSKTSKFSCSHELYAQANLVKFRFDNPIHIEVGTITDSKSYMIHGAFLTSRSLFFKKALSDDWKETPERIVKLPEDETDTFELYLHCVYNQEINLDPYSLLKDYVGHEARLELAKLYVFAERIQDIRAKNTAIKAFLKSVWGRGSSWYHPAVASVQVIYDGTAEGSPMHRLLVDIYAHAIRTPAKFDINYPREFFVELVDELTKARLDNTGKRRGLECGDPADDYLEPETEADN
jgi:hypothetical protein